MLKEAEKHNFEQVREAKVVDLLYFEITFI